MFSAVKKLGVRFDGAKRDYVQSSRRFVIPPPTPLPDPGRGEPDALSARTSRPLGGSPWPCFSPKVRALAKALAGPLHPLCPHATQRLGGSPQPRFAPKVPALASDSCKCRAPRRGGALLPTVITPGSTRQLRFRGLSPLSRQMLRSAVNLLEFCSFGAMHRNNLEVLTSPLSISGNFWRPTTDAPDGRPQAPIPPTHTNTAFLRSAPKCRPLAGMRSVDGAWQPFRKEEFVCQDRFEKSQRCAPEISAFRRPSRPHAFA